MCQREYQRDLKQVQLPTIWTIPEKMWQRIRPLLPPEKEPGTPGRPPVPFRKVMDGILFVLRTGCQWKALPRCYGSGSFYCPSSFPTVGRSGHHRCDRESDGGVV